MTDPLVAELKDLRARLNVRQADIAERIGHTQSCISYWEAGRHSPRGAARIVLGQIIADLRAAAAGAPDQGAHAP